MRAPLQRCRVESEGHHTRRCGARTSIPLSIPSTLDRICHRYPSLLVDDIAEHEPGRRIVAVKNVTVSEEFFQGHFPGAPLLPAVLMIETLMQVATLLLLDQQSE